MKKAAVSVLLFILFWCFLAWVRNPMFATIVLALLSIHEAGHLIAMARNGIPVRGLYFIPLLGAVITTDKITDRWKGVKVSLGGPLLGAVSAAALLAAYALWPSPVLAAAAFFAAILNAFNMLPIFPVDGGQALAYATDTGGSHDVTAKRMWILYVASLVVIALAFDAYLMAAILGFFGSSAVKEYLRDLARREDRTRIRAALAEALEVAPDDVVAAVEAPLRRLAAGEEPDFPKKLLDLSPKLFAAEGCRRIDWCVPDDEDHAAISDDDAYEWGRHLDRILDRAARDAYDKAVQALAADACGSYRIGLLSSGRSVTFESDLRVGPIFAPPTPLIASVLGDGVKLASTPTRFAAYMTEHAPTIPPERSRQGLIAFAALSAALLGLTLAAGMAAGWSLTALY